MRVKKIIGLAAAVALAAMIQPAYAQNAAVDAPALDAAQFRNSIIGSWVMDVDAAGAPDFQAIQTFHLGGSMTESTDLIATLTEGPGSGSWRRTGENEFLATFELFFFNPDHTPGGRVRVRETIKLVDENNLTAVAVVDLIFPDGTILEAVDVGNCKATRVQVLPVRPEELTPKPNAHYRAGRVW